MKKSYFLIGGICLSAIAMSCDTDDNLKQIITHQQETRFQQEIQPKEIIIQANNEDLKPDRGDEDKDKDKDKGNEGN